MKGIVKRIYTMWFSALSGIEEKRKYECIQRTPALTVWIWQVGEVLVHKFISDLSIIKRRGQLFHGIKGMQLLRMFFPWNTLVSALLNSVVITLMVESNFFTAELYVLIFPPNLLPPFISLLLFLSLLVHLTQPSMTKLWFSCQELFNKTQGDAYSFLLLVWALEFCWKCLILDFLTYYYLHFIVFPKLLLLFLCISTLSAHQDPNFV